MGRRLARRISWTVRLFTATCQKGYDTMYVGQNQFKSRFLF